MSSLYIAVFASLALAANAGHVALNAPLLAAPGAPLAYTAAGQYVYQPQPAGAFYPRAAPFIAPAAAPFAYRSAPLINAAAIAAPITAPLAVAKTARLAVAAPFAHAAANLEFADSYPQYAYAYNVHDTITGDSKTQEESRDGDVVKGSYSLIEPDGSRRTVNYYADPINGFNAVVQKDLPVAAAPIVAAKHVLV